MQQPNDASNVNYQYFVDYVKTRCAESAPRVLDFGCGKGEMVSLFRENGIDCHGTDVFYADTLEAMKSRPLFQEGVLVPMDAGGAIPFPPHSFDIIISNQVFEHVVDKEAALRAMEEALKPNGFMLHHFPSKEVIREGHIGIPMVHWMAPGRFRYAYTYLLRALGLGFFKEGTTIKGWTDYRLDWIDKYCEYEPYSALKPIFSKRFELRHEEILYCRFRARHRPMLSAVLSVDSLAPIYERLFRRLGFMSLHLTPKRDREAQLP